MQIFIDANKISVTKEKFLEQKFHGGLVKLVALIIRVATVEGRFSCGRRETAAGITTTATATVIRTASGRCPSAARRRTARCLGTARRARPLWRRPTVPVHRGRNKWWPLTCIIFARPATRARLHRHPWPLVYAPSPSRPTETWLGGICNTSSWGQRNLPIWKLWIGWPTVLDEMVSWLYLYNIEFVFTWSFKILEIEFFREIIENEDWTFRWNVKEKKTLIHMKWELFKLSNLRNVKNNSYG